MVSKVICYNLYWNGTFYWDILIVVGIVWVLLIDIIYEKLENDVERK